jgi:hypothetical protein
MVFDDVRRAFLCAGNPLVRVFFWNLFSSPKPKRHSFLRSRASFGFLKQYSVHVWPDMAAVPQPPPPGTGDAVPQPPPPSTGDAVPQPPRLVAAVDAVPQPTPPSTGDAVPQPPMAAVPQPPPVASAASAEPSIPKFQSTAAVPSVAYRGRGHAGCLPSVNNAIYDFDQGHTSRAGWLAGWLAGWIHHTSESCMDGCDRIFCSYLDAYVNSRCCMHI